MFGTVGPEELNGFLDEARDEHRILTYVYEKNKGRKISGTHTGICPVCKRRTMIVEKERFFCLSCGRTGDIFQLMALTEGKSLTDIVRTRVKGIDAVLSAREEKIREISHAAGEWYVKNITPEAFSYIRGRGLTDEDIEEFSIGFAPMGKDRLLQALKDLGYTEEDVLAAGLATQMENGDVIDRFRNRVMFPIRGKGGYIIGFGGRAAGDWKPKYLNSPTSICFDKKNILYGMDRLDPLEPVIICEGYMDAIALKKSGYNAAAVLGTAFGEGHIPLIKNCGMVYVATDSDTPGIISAGKAIALLLEYGIPAKRIDFSPAKDPDEFLIRFGKEKLNERIRDAEDGERFLVRTSDDQSRAVIDAFTRTKIPELF